MKKTILISTITYFLGAVSMYFLISPNDIGEISKNIKESIPLASFDIKGTRWIDESGEIELFFTEDDNMCYIVKQNLSIPFSYSKIKNEFTLEPKNELSGIFLLSMSSFNLSGTFDHEKLELRGNERIINFKRIK